MDNHHSRISFITLLICICLGSLVALPLGSIIDIPAAEMFAMEPDGDNLLEQVEPDDEYLMNLLAVSCDAILPSNSGLAYPLFADHPHAPVSPPPEHI